MRTDILAFLRSSLETLRETGKAPAERTAWETKVFLRRPKRLKRAKNPRSMAAIQFAKYYQGDKRSRDVRE